MSALDVLLQNITSKLLTQENLAFMLITIGLRKRGIELNPQQKKQLQDQIAEQLPATSDGDSSLYFDLDDIPEELDGIALISTDEDYAELGNILNGRIEFAISEVIPVLSQKLIESWKEEAPQTLRLQQDYQKGFTQRIQHTWGNGLDLLDILLSTSLEMGMEFNKTYRSEACSNQDMVFEALTRLHARGCQVGREIHVLLTNGLADGAYARWRTLHELAVVADFLKNHDNITAERFLLHEHIDTYKSALQYQKHCSMLGRQPLSKNDMDHLRQRHDTLVARFGRDFKNNWGWAAVATGKTSPNFSDIEKQSGLEHIRPFVKEAHGNVHASAKGTLQRLGLIPEVDILLAGPSIFGLGEPGRNTAFSTLLLTTSLLLLRPTLEHISYVTAMQTLHQEIHDAFYEAEYEIAQHEA